MFSGDGVAAALVEDVKVAAAVVAEDAVVTAVVVVEAVKEAAVETAEAAEAVEVVMVAMLVDAKGGADPPASDSSCVLENKSNNFTDVYIIFLL